MRYIRKGAEPAKFRQWKQNNQALAPNFKNIGGEAKKALREHMSIEQGQLCAYTMWPLDSRVRSHIEHIRPQSRYPEFALAYNNMVLCVTGAGDWRFPFGANRKDDTDVTNDNFLSPLHRSCESRLRFRRDGEVIAAKSGDRATENTIRLLDLNHPFLVESRRQAIELQLFGRGTDRLPSPAQARRLAENAIVADNQNRLPPFCIAVRQVAWEIAYQREKLARRLAARQAR